MFLAYTLMVTDLVDFDRDEKAVDLASLYIQILIGLASGIIVAVLAFYEDISKAPGVDLLLVKISITMLALSIMSGLYSMGGIIGALKDKPDAKTLTPYAPHAKFPALIQLVSYAVGIGFMVGSLH